MINLAIATTIFILFCSAVSSNVQRIHAILRDDPPYSSPRYNFAAGVYYYTESVLDNLAGHCGYMVTNRTYVDDATLYKILFLPNPRQALLKVTNRTSSDNTTIFVMGLISQTRTQRTNLSNFHINHIVKSPGVVVVAHVDSISLTWKVLEAINDVQILMAIALCFTVLAGMAIWCCERLHESSDFAEDMSGIYDGFWWSFVTWTTTGYGDKVPKTTVGRIFACIWMLLAAIILCVLTSVLTDSLSKSKIDIKDKKVAVVNNSVEELAAKTAFRCQHVIPTPSYKDCLMMVEKNEAFATIIDYNVVASMEHTFEERQLASVQRFDFPLQNAIHIFRSPLTDQYVSRKMIPCLDKLLPHIDDLAMRLLGPTVSTRTVHIVDLAEIMRKTGSPIMLLACVTFSLLIVFLVMDIIRRLRTYLRSHSQQSPSTIIEPWKDKFENILEERIMQFKDELLNELKNFEKKSSAKRSLEDVMKSR